MYLPGTPQTKVSASLLYDDAGETIQVTQPLSTTSTMTRYFGFDEAGRAKTYRDAKGTTTYSTNLAGWLTSVADPRPETVGYA